MALRVVGFVALFLIVFAPSASAFDDESDDFECIGTSPIKFSPGRFIPSSKPQRNRRNFLVDFTIPNTTHHVQCEIVENLHLLPDETDEDDEDDFFNVTNDDSCHYAGLATFDEFPYRTKCLFSLCQGFRSGMVWLPGERAYLQVIVNEDDSLANFTKKGRVSNYSMLDPDPDGNTARQFAPKTADNVHWAHRLLLDTMPPDWYHFRVMALISAESFYSDVFRGDRQVTVNTISSAFNLINVIYSQLNITVYLKRIVIWTGEPDKDGVPAKSFPDSDWSIEPTPFHYVLNPHISLVNEYVWPKITRRSAVDYMVFVRNINGRTIPGRTNPVGYAYLNTVCQNKARSGCLLSVRTANVATVPQTIVTLATIISHELGHAFGAKDENGSHGCYCPSSDRRCIMWGGLDKEHRRLVQWAWSSCSVESIGKYLKSLAKKDPLCLHEIPHVPPAYDNLTDPVCGNGILEEGEECDCGPGTSKGGPPRHYFSTIFCENPNCCDYQTCKLRGNAQCANGPCCDSSTCQFYDNLTICREALTECDILEVCPGNSSLCPRDLFYMTGTPCTNNGTVTDGSCYYGKCASRQERCGTLMGGSFELNKTDQCLEFNKEGWFAANCGHRHYIPDKHYDQSTHENSMNKCAPDDVECGSLMCTEVNDTFFNQHSVTPNRHDLKDANITCHSIAGQMLPDVGLAPDGLLCAQGRKYCYRQRCQFEVPKCDEPPPCDYLGHHVSNETNEHLSTPRPPTRPPPHNASHRHDSNFALTVFTQTVGLMIRAKFAIMK